MNNICLAPHNRTRPPRGNEYHFCCSINLFANTALHHNKDIWNITALSKVTVVDRVTLRPLATSCAVFIGGFVVVSLSNARPTPCRPVLLQRTSLQYPSHSFVFHRLCFCLSNLSHFTSSSLLFVCLFACLCFVTRLLALPFTYLIFVVALLLCVMAGSFPFVSPLSSSCF